MKQIIGFIALLMLVSCSNKPLQIKNTLIKQTKLSLKTAAKDTIVVIYNHGTRNPRKTEQCGASYNLAPTSLLELQSDRLLVDYLCSNATEGPSPDQAGNQVYGRRFEIEQRLDYLIAQGIDPKNIFLSGHSKGGWAVLMSMKEVNKKFNAAIVFAPALANRRSANNYPWWRNVVRPKQIQQMLSVKTIDALIYAYQDDEYNRPQDLAFLFDRYPNTVKLIEYRCEYPYTHNTHLHDCRSAQTKSQIRRYIQQQVAQWN